MATPTLLQHYLHGYHPLELLDFSKDLSHPVCDLCETKISADGYACKEKCLFYAHRVCAEVPPQIDLHPLHSDHPLTLRLDQLSFTNHVCNLCDFRHHRLFRCDECDFNLDFSCALSTLSDRGGTQWKSPEQIKLPLHHHLLTSFYRRYDFVNDSDCVICKASVEGDGYVCLNWRCEFLIHKRCIPGLYYADGTKAPQVYHRHPLETFLGKDTDSIRCAKCGSKASSGEFIGCVECQVFYCRDCVQVPESIQYPHHPDHDLVLLINSTDNEKQQECDSCSYYLLCDLCYGCPSCAFFKDVGCALQILAYCEEGMSAEIKLPWLEDPLRLCHRISYYSFYCYSCGDESAGPMYTCKENGSEILFHKQCTEIESTIIHPHHPDHPLTLCKEANNFTRCGACCEKIRHLYFSCKVREFYLDPKCAAHFPTRKHSLHEHELIHLDEAPFCKCNRCGTSTWRSPFFRCVPCNFNLHEECMELPTQVVNSAVHWHPLTLHETYIEDDSGEYYCDQCEKRRNERMGAYVCLQCSARWVYHMECVFPELHKVFAKEDNAAEIERLADDIARREEEVREVERKLEEMKRELDEQMKKHAALKGGFNTR